MKTFACIILLVSFLNAAEQGISGETLLQWIDGNAPSEFIIIDIRDSASTRSTGIIGKNKSCSAYNIPFTMFTLTEIDSILEMFPKDTAIVFYCFSEHMSITVAKDFSNFKDGFDKIFYLEKGFRAWEGPSVSSDMAKPNSTFPSTFCSASSVSFRPSQKMQKTRTNFLFDIQGRTFRNAAAPGIHILNNKPVLFLDPFLTSCQIETQKAFKY